MVCLSALRVLGFVGLGILAGCSAGRGTLAEDVDFKGADGKRRYEIEADGRGFEVNDGDKRELLDFRYEGDVLRIEGPANVLLGRVGAEGGAVVVREADGKQACRLSVVGNGDVQVDGPNGVAYRLERRNDGFKIVDGAGVLVGRAKVDDKIALHDAAGKITLECKPRLSPLAASCLALESIPLPQRLGMLVGVVAFRVGD